MLNTVVCKKEGCKGNRFKISVQRLKVLMICTECKVVEKLNRGNELSFSYYMLEVHWRDF
ncbi:hypothetical protein [Clostridium sp. OS1-26]|uniref:hypothetical protein n=1 Tax=Clostridium sp. OS1-26 TaxID=3070681 RepID=UPI0027E18386|nr:hypothetical protein [Clostridium sp. OS1-26]WML33988.1 hypothetical protein RCG18_22115 [Clostridium sp. OS1-26]